MQRFLRGQIWWSKPNASVDMNSLTPKERTALFGNIQQGIRPVIIVSNNTGNRNSQILQIVPCTTAFKKPLPTHCTLYIGDKLNTVLCEQLTTIKKSDLYNYVGTVDANEMQELDNCLKISLGMIKELPAYVEDKSFADILEKIKEWEEKKCQVQN